MERKKKGNVKLLVMAFAAMSVICTSCSGSPIQTAGNGDSGSSVASVMGAHGETNENIFSQEAINEYVKCIDQSAELIAKTDNEIVKFDAEDGIEGYRKQATVLENLLADLADVENKANAISGVDTKLKNAGNEYFTMVNDAYKASYEVWIFLTDYLVFCEDYLAYWPREENYDTTKEYYNELNAWYESAKEAYTAIDSCPPCMEGEWKQYGEILDLNDDIINKLYLANVYGDNLRYLSALNMSNRFETVEALQFEDILNCLIGEAEHLQAQSDLSSDLVKELHIYAELDEEERVEYEFKSIRTGKIRLSYDTVDTIYPSLYHSYDAFVIIKTGCISGEKKILVEMEIPGFTQSYKETIALDSAYREIHIKPPALASNLNLSSSKNAQIKVTISEQDGTLLEAKSFPVTIKSKYDFEWYSDEYGVATQDNILCFLTPEAAAISRLKRQAIEEITNMTGGKMESFVGYQNTRWNNHYVGTYVQVAGIMRALYETGVRYNMDPFSISGSNQHILFPEDVLEQKSGLCIETSLTVASALQSAGMHVFLVFPPGHAQVAVEVWNGRGEDKSGTGKYFLIETTALSSDWNNQKAFVDDANALLSENRLLGTSPISYYNQEEWYRYLTKEGTYLVDCDDLSAFNLAPFSN